MSLLRVLPSFLLLIGSAHAQSSGHAGMPCAINNNMKGTCFYSADGEVSHWIVRVWRQPVEGGGPEGSFKEVVGYPAFLKEQQDYNRWIKSASPVPGLEIDVPTSTASNSLAFSETHAVEIWDPIKGKLTTGDVTGPAYYSSHHGWQTDSWGVKRIWIPSGIAETGALDPDTLRIPIFMTAGKILAARERLKNECSSASDLYYQWDQLQPVSRSDMSTRGFCVLSIHLPHGAGFADWQRLLDARADSLALAETSSRRFDDLVGGLQHTIIQYETQSFTPDQLPAGLVDQLLRLQAASEAALRVADSLESKSATLSKEYRRRTEQLVQRHESAMKKEACERFSSELHEKYDKEWLEKYGRPFPVEPCND